MALRDDATCEVIGVTRAHAPYSRGHVDCTGIVQDGGVAKAIPIVEVDNPLAKVTHEAAIGNVDKNRWKHSWHGVCLWGMLWMLLSRVC